MKPAGKYICLLVLMCSCNAGNDENFYYEKTWQDGRVLPLIKPYRLFQPYGSEDLKIWVIPFKDGEYVNASHITVEKNYIAGYEQNLNPKGWFVINSATKSEKKFASWHEFDSCLREKDLANLKFYNSDSLYLIFEKTDNLPWEKK